MSLFGTGVGVGDGVVLNTETTAERVNSYQSDRLDRGTQFVVTRVYTNRVQVRTVAVFTSQYSNQARGRSYILDKGHLDMDDGATRAAEQAGVTVPRRLGKKPEDTEEMTYINIVAQVQARSQAEANRLVHEAIRGKAEEGPSDNDPEPEPTPSDPRYPIAA
jgi:hypothetical protein